LFSLLLEKLLLQLPLGLSARLLQLGLSLLLPLDPLVFLLLTELDDFPDHLFLLVNQTLLLLFQLLRLLNCAANHFFLLLLLQLLRHPERLLYTALSVHLNLLRLRLKLAVPFNHELLESHEVVHSGDLVHDLLVHRVRGRLVAGV
jgi:hypothetical protein